MKTVTPVELESVLEKQSIELIDLRPKEEFQARHALGARSIPLPDLEPRAVLAHRKMDRNAPIYLLGDKMMLASLAAGALVGAGLEEAVVIEGGFEAWEKEGLPVVRARPWPRVSAFFHSLSGDGHSWLTPRGRQRVEC